MTPQARVQAAVELLDEVISAARDGGAAADTLIARYFKTRRYAGSKDRRAVRDLVYAAIRRSGDKPASGRSAILGLALTDATLAPLFDGSLHGPAPIGPDEEPAGASAVPAWLKPFLAEPVQNMEEIGALLERAPLDLRINRLKDEPEAILEAFRGAIEIIGLPGALRLAEGTIVEQTHAYQEGLVEIQDLGSQLIAQVCQAKPGMTAIDMCAGAGGKTLALAADMNNVGKLIAADVSRERLSRLPDRAIRAGATCIETRLLNPGRELESLASLNETADIVLVDAPCSGTGTWRRNPEARWRLTAQRLDRLAREQSRILKFAAELVRPGGHLVYAVCALTDAEGKGQVEQFLNSTPGWKSTDPGIALGRIYGEGRLLTPAHDGTDGFFIARLVRQ